MSSTSSSSSAQSRAVTCSAPSNIAVIKYWGKRDAELNLPLNSSVSLTFDQDVLRTVTTVTASAELSEDSLWLNDKRAEVAGSKRLRAVFSHMRALARKHSALPDAERLASWHVQVVSRNSFPTAAGLASSASGFACLVFALARLYGLELAEEGYDLTVVARQGSGSACRSLMGGFVEWTAGTRGDGLDSRAVQVQPEAHWPELTFLILVANAGEKDVGSTDGMQTSARTSPLLQYRAERVVPQRLRAIEQAFADRDFETFGTLTMQDSNQFHATCLDTYPPIFYLNDVSHRIIHWVHELNAAAGRVKVAYTFDAGPNAVLLMQRDDVEDVLRHVLRSFPPAAHTALDEFLRTASAAVRSVAAECIRAMEEEGVDAPSASVLKCIYHTQVGGGPRELAADEALAPPLGV